MSDSKKTTIVIASVLKPVDDSRMYEKIGLSLALAGQYDVHIIGCVTEAAPDARLSQHPFPPFARISLRRMFAPLLIFIRSLRLKPRVFIATTHELLFPAMFLKMFIRCRVIYDVQENYYWNILYTPAFPLLAKPFLALYVRAKETLSAPYVDHFFLAERGYEKEMKFPRNRKTILENKVRVDRALQKTAVPLTSKKTIDLLFSGTLAPTTGVFTAIDLAVKLHVIDERIRLTIIGYAAQTKVLEKIRMLIHPRPFIELIAHDRPVPHAQIFDHIRKADFGVISYEVNPSTMNSIPTKLYEYLGLRLPILLTSHRPWVDFCYPWNAAVVFDAHHPDAAGVYKQMMSQTFYTSEPTEVYWQSEEERLLSVVHSVAEG